MLSKLLAVAAIILAVWAVGDVLRLLKGSVERFLWIVCILMLPGLGAGLWIAVQYGGFANDEAPALDKENARKDEPSGHR